MVKKRNTENVLATVAVESETTCLTGSPLHREYADDSAVQILCGSIYQGCVLGLTPDARLSEIS